MPLSSFVRVATVCALTTGAFVAPGIGAASPRSPGLRLFGVVQHVDAQRFDGQTDVFLSPGIYVGATDGAFEIDAVAQPDGGVALWQVRRDSHGAHRVRQITSPSPTVMEQGLPAFFRVVLTDADGARVVTSDLPFCPSNGFGSSRMDASGPYHPTYPDTCGGPLTKAAVWGLDRGWASATYLDLPLGDNAPDGDYTLTMSVAPVYAQQLNIPAGSATATVAVTITTGPGGPCVPECGPHPASTTARLSRPNALAGNDGVHEGSGGPPDLRSLPAHDLSIEHNEDDGHDYLDFGATIWNAGSGPLVMEGFRSGSAPVMAATQFIYQDGKVTRSASVGQFEFDTRQGHNHWHMEDIAQYDLLDASGSRIVLSDKQSFCLAPTDAIDLTLPGAQWQPNQAALWSACAGEESIWLREVLPAGWGDSYYQSVAGQSFDITNLANGHYKIRVTTDPAHRLIETAYDNNSAVVDIELGGTAGQRTVTTT